MVGTHLPASVLPGLLEMALRGRLDAATLFERAGVDLGAGDRYLTLDQLDRLLSTVFRDAGDPLFGLRAGRDHDYRRLDLLGRLMAAASTLEQALALLFRYKNLVVPYLAFQLERGEHHCTLTITGGDGLTFARHPAHDDLVLASLVAVGRSLLGGRMPVHRVLVRHPPPTQRDEYDAFFQCPLNFGAPSNAIEFSPALLGQTLPAANAHRRARLEAAAAGLLLDLSRAGGVAGCVLERLRGGLGQGGLTVERVAADLNMTARTLQRRLRDEGVQFARLRDQVRMEYACRRLREPCCDMGHLALYLGFSDTANFYHAFKRWKGCAPGEYRRRALARPRPGPPRP